MKNHTHRSFVLLLSSVLALAATLAPTSAPAQSTWTNNANGFWTNSANWVGGVPSNIDATAILSTNVTAARIITNDVNTVLGTIIISNATASAYTITTNTAGAGRLTFQASGGNNATWLDYLAGTPVINVPITLNSSLNISNVNGGLLTLSSGINGGNNGLIVGGANNTTISGVGITNLSSLTKIDAGTLTVSGPINGANGGFVDKAGTLTISGPVAMSSALTLSNLSATALSVSGTITNNGSTLTVGGGSNTTISGIISGSGGLTKIDGGLLTLSGANTYSNGTVLMGGTVNINADAALGGVPAAVATNIIFGGNSTLQAAGAMTLNANRSLLISNGVTATLDSQGIVFTVNGATYNSGTLAHIGAGTLALSNVTSSGVISNNAGTLTVNATRSLSGTVLNSAGTMNLNSGVALSGTTTISNQSATVLTIGGTLTNNGNALTIGGSGNTTMSSGMSGATALNKIDGGVLTINGASSGLSGGIVANGGTLQFGSIQANGALNTLATIGMGGALTISNMSPTALAFYGAITNGGNLLTIGGTGNVVQGSAGGAGQGITGSGGLLKIDSGTLTLNAFGGANNFGSLTINGGTVSIASASDTQLGTVPVAPATNIIFGGNGTLQYTAASLALNANRIMLVSNGVTATLNGQMSPVNAANTWTIGGNIVDDGTLVLAPSTGFGGTAGAASITLNNLIMAGGLVNSMGPIYSTLALGTASGYTNYAGADTVAGYVLLTGSSTISNASRGLLTLSGAVTNGGNALTVGGNGNTTISGGITGAGTLTKIDSGVLSVSSGNNNYSGGTLVSGGTLAGTANGSLQGNITNNATLLFGYAGTLVGTLSGSGTNIFSPVAAQFNLTNANTYTGPTVVNAGTLSLSNSAGSIANSSSVTLNSSTLVLDNRSVTNVARVGTGTAIILNGGTETLLGGFATNGVVTLATGASTMNTASNGILVSASLTHNVGATVNFTGTNIFTTGPSMTGGILPYATYAANDFATTNASGMIVALPGYQTNNFGNASNNVYLSAITNFASSTVNSLKQNINLALTNSAGVGQTLTLSSGGLLVSGGAGTYITNGTVAFGGAEAVINDANNASIYSPVTGSGGLTKVGAGILSLFGSNTLTGQVTVNQGTLNLTNGNYLNLGDNLIVNQASLTMNGGTLIANQLVASNNTTAVSMNSGNLTTLNGSIFTNALIMNNGMTWHAQGGTNTLMNYNGNTATFTVNAGATVDVSGASTVLSNAGAISFGGYEVVTNGAKMNVAYGSIVGGTFLVSDPGGYFSAIGWAQTGGQTVVSNGALFVSSVTPTYSTSVSGTGSRLTVTGAGTIYSNLFGGTGVSGGGTLVIANGAKYVTISDDGAEATLTIGGTPGTGIVTGAGSILIASNSFGTAGGIALSNGGSNGVLRVDQGGQIVASSISLGFNGGFNNLMTVTDTGSVVTASSVALASGGQNTLIISNGAKVFASSVLLDAGNNNKLVVTGAGSLLTNNNVTLGVNTGAWSNNTLTVSAGAQMLTGPGQGEIARNVGNNNDFVLITDPGSIWTNQGLLTFGDAGNNFNNSLIVSNGGAVIITGANNLTMGGASTNDSVIVTGPGSRLQLGTGSISIGGVIGSLMVNNGGFVAANGLSSAGPSNVVQITGAGTLVTNTGAFTVSGTQSKVIVDRATLYNNGVSTISGGAQDLLLVTNAATLYTVGNFNFTGVTNGNVIATGAGTTLTATNGAFALLGVQNAMAISQGAQFQALLGGTVSTVTGSSNTVTVTDAGGLFNTPGGLTVGNAGYGNQVTFANGAKAYSGAAIVGTNAGDFHSITVDGAGSVWTNNGMTVGIGNTLTQFSIVTNKDIVGTTTNTYSMFWTNNLAGVNNQVAVNNGAQMQTLNAIISSSSEVTGPTAGTNYFLNEGGFTNVIVNITTNNGSSVVGAFTNFNVPNITTAAIPTQYNLNQVTIAGSGSVWSNVQSILIGTAASSAPGWLVVSNGATVVNNTSLGASGSTNIVIGSAAGSTGIVVVTGTGSFLQELGANGKLDVGTNSMDANAAGIGQVTILNGMVEANQIGVGGIAGSWVTNTGGTYQFTTGTPTISTGKFGAVVMDGGTISFRGVASANVYGNVLGANSNQLVNVTYSGNNTFQLNGSSNTANVVSYTFGTGFGATNYTALNMINGTTLWQSTNLNINSGSSMLVSNTTATIRGVLANAGTIEITGSTATFQGPVANNGFFGIQADNSQVTIQSNVDNNSYLTLNNSATTVQGYLDTENALAVNGGSLTVQGGLTNGAYMTVAGGTWTNQGSVNNQGVITVVGNAVIQGTVTNANGAALSVTGGSLLVQGNDVNNQGSIQVNNSAALFLSPLTIGGSYISDPSTNTFGSNVTVSASGFMMGTPGDVFNFQQSLFIHSTNNIQFDLSTSTVEFSGGGVHTNAITGMDVGANAFGQNFEYGRLTLASTNDLLQFTQGGTSVSNALYVQTLDLSAFVGDYTSVSNMVASLLYAPSSINVYYLAPMNGYLSSLRYPLESFPGGGPGGFLIPAIPEPSTMLLWVMGAGCIAWLRRRRS